MTGNLAIFRGSTSLSCSTGCFTLFWKLKILSPDSNITIQDDAISEGTRLITYSCHCCDYEEQKEERIARRYAGGGGGGGP